MSTDPSASNVGGGSPPPVPHPGTQAGKRAPRKVWYVVAAGMLSAGIVLAAVGIGLIVDVFGKSPSADHTFASGESNTLHLDADETRVVFLANHVGAHHIQCRATGRTNAEIALKRFTDSLTLNEWQAYFTLSPNRAGDYAIRCTGVASDRFGVSGDATAGAFLSGAFAILAGGVLSVIAVIALVITAVLRGRRKGSEDGRRINAATNAAFGAMNFRACPPSAGHRMTSASKQSVDVEAGRISMGDQFSLDSAGLTSFSNLHSEVSDAMSGLVGTAGTGDLAAPFGNIASAVRNAIGGVSESRGGTFQTTKGSAATIADLLAKAHQMYMQGDQQGADELKAQAEAMASGGGAGSAGGGAAGGSTGAGGPGAGAAGGGGADSAGQMVSQVGQQVGQIAQGLAQSMQGLAQGLTQLPQQIMQGVQGMAQSAGKGTGADDPAKAKDEKANEREEHDREEAEKRAEEQRRERRTPPVHSDGAEPGRAADGGRAPVPPPPVERPRPAPTLPPRSNL